MSNAWRSDDEKCQVRLSKVTQDVARQSPRDYNELQFFFLDLHSSQSEKKVH